MTTPNRVLVAGAGPVGLVAANVLADAGISVTVFESDPALSKNLRASTFQPSTLDLLAPFGVNDRLEEMGLKAPHMQYRDRHGWMHVTESTWSDVGLETGRVVERFQVDRA